MRIHVTLETERSVSKVFIGRMHSNVIKLALTPPLRKVLAEKDSNLGPIILVVQFIVFQNTFSALNQKKLHGTA